ncbi:MAG TPA: phosphodiester glycosidase family protein, partial [Longimicrobiales bacterium]|nr:phosphodiester glycosidase family protein [Longimicrobiales bacterium]
DTVRTETVGPGVHYHRVRSVESVERPLAIHLLEVERSVCEVGLAVGVPADVGAGEGGFARVSDIAAEYPGDVVAAVNGDFFSAAGYPVGAEVGPVGVRSSSASAALVVRDYREPWIGRTGVDVDSERLSGPEWSLDGPRPVQVVGGLPELLDVGLRVGDLEVSARPGFAAARHPRTGIGFDDERIWIVAVDGRRDGYSAGMTLPELTRVFEALGVEEALNLDGGGSTVMIVGGQVVSRPSDPTGERSVVNALLLVNDPTLCR